MTSDAFNALNEAEKAAYEEKASQKLSAYRGTFAAYSDRRDRVGLFNIILTKLTRTRSQVTRAIWAQASAAAPALPEADTKRKPEERRRRLPTEA